MTESDDLRLDEQEVRDMLHEIERDGDRIVHLWDARAIVAAIRELPEARAALATERARAEGLTTERRELRIERDALADAIEKAIAAMKAKTEGPDARPVDVCGWCGAFAPLSCVDLRTHIAQCEKNPVLQRALAAEAALREARARAEALGRLILTCPHGINGSAPSLGYVCERCRALAPAATTTPTARGALARCPETASGRLPPDELSACEFCPGTAPCLDFHVPDGDLAPLPLVTCPCGTEFSPDLHPTCPECARALAAPQKETPDA